MRRDNERIWLLFERTRDLFARRPTLSSGRITPYLIKLAVFDLRKTLVGWEKDVLACVYTYSSIVHVSL